MRHHQQGSRGHRCDHVAGVHVTADQLRPAPERDTVHSMEIPPSGWKEGNVLFNDALNTFYLRLYGVRHMVEDHSESERGNPLPSHGLLFPTSSKCSFRCIIPHTTAFVTPVMEHWLEREIAQSVHEGSIRRPIEL